MTSFNEGQHETRTPGGALAAIAGRAKHCFAQGLTRAEGIPLGRMPDRRIAGSPDRRIAGSPDRRIAGSPDRRIAGSPDRRIAGSPDRRIAGSPDRRIAGSPDRRIAGSPDRRIAGSPDRRIAGSIVFTALLLVSSPAYADTVTMNCPSSVIEGGLVAQATNCPSPDLPIGYPYCEYRDGAGADDWSIGTLVGSKRIESASITIDATTGGRWYVFPASTSIYLSGHSSNGYQIDSGDTVDIDIKVYATGNYRRTGNSEGTIGVYMPGNQTISNPDFACDITIQDDDNSAYIGQRNHHPYGGTWQTTPHCFTHGCGWD